MKAIYAALLEPLNGEGYAIRVPDVSGCVTTGKDLVEAMDNIQDALCGCLCVLEDEGQLIPPPTAPEAVGDGKQTVVLVQVDTDKYRRETDTRAIRKNVSLPAWLAYLADKKGINCSQALQRELKRQLHVN